MQPDRAIKAIYGHEPMRAGEYPLAFEVGSLISGKGETVYRITYREHNFGDHGLGWFDVYTAETLIISVQARAVAEVHYANS